MRLKLISLVFLCLVPATEQAFSFRGGFSAVKQWSQKNPKKAIACAGLCLGIGFISGLILGDKSRTYYQDHYTLHGAARRGDLQRLKELIAKNPNLPSDEYDRALNCAISNNNLNIVKYLHENQKVDVTQPNKYLYYETPLHHATFYSSLPIVQYLIETCKIDPTTKDSKGNTPLHLAVNHDFSNSKEKFEIIKYLIETCKMNVDEPNKQKETPLLHNLKSTPLYSSTYKNYDPLNTAKYLVNSCKADIHKADNDGITPFTYLLLHKEKSEFYDALDDCDSSKYLRNVKLRSHKNAYSLLEYWFNICKLDPNAPNQKGQTPLFLSAAFSNFPVLKFLVKKGALVDKRTRKGFTSLMAASDNNDVVSLNYLIKNGADINAVDSQGYSPLLFGRKNLSVIKCLTEEGADIDMRDTLGHSIFTLSDTIPEARKYLTSVKDYYNDGTIATTTRDINNNLVNPKLIPNYFPLAAHKNDIIDLRSFHIPENFDLKSFITRLQSREKDKNTIAELIWIYLNKHAYKDNCVLLSNKKIIDKKPWKKIVTQSNLFKKQKIHTLHDINFTHV